MTLTEIIPLFVLPFPLTRLPSRPQRRALIKTPPGEVSLSIFGGNIKHRPPVALKVAGKDK